MKCASKVLGLCFLLAVLAGCGGGSGTTTLHPPVQQPRQLPAGTELLYVGDDVGVIHGFGVDPNSGSLTPLPTVAVTNGTAAADVGLTADAGGHVLYATSDGIGGPNLASFVVDQTTGALSVSSQLSLPVPVRKLVAAPGGGAGPPCCVYVIPDSSAKAAQLFQFTVDRFNAALTQVTPSITLPCVPDDLTSDPAGSWLGITCQGNLGGEAVGLGRDPVTGSLGTTMGVATGGNSPQGIRVTPDGNFVVIANQATNNVSVFSLDANTGVLTAVTGSPFATGGQPGPVAIDPSGKFVFVGDTGGNSLSAFTIDAAGSLTPVPGTAVSLGINAQPVAIAVDPGGKFVYVSIVPQQVAGFAFDSNTGALAPITGSPFSLGAVARDMAFVP